MYKLKKRQQKRRLQEKRKKNPQENSHPRVWKSFWRPQQAPWKVWKHGPQFQKVFVHKEQCLCCIICLRTGLWWNKEASQASDLGDISEESPVPKESLRQALQEGGLMRSHCHHRRGSLWGAFSRGRRCGRGSCDNDHPDQHVSQGVCVCLSF